MEKCILCDKGTLEIEYHPFTFKFDRITYTIPNIKYKICNHCGEKYIDEETSQFIDEWTKENVYKKIKDELRSKKLTE